MRKRSFCVICQRTVFAKDILCETRKQHTRSRKFAPFGAPNNCYYSCSFIVLLLCVLLLLRLVDPFFTRSRPHGFLTTCCYSDVEVHGKKKKKFMIILKNISAWLFIERSSKRVMLQPEATQLWRTTDSILVLSDKNCYMKSEISHR